MNRKKKGINAERKAKEILEQAGYLVIRSAGSLGPFDLIALNRSGHVRLIQVKKNKIITEEEKENLFNLAAEYKRYSVEYWYFPPREKKPVITTF